MLIVRIRGIFILLQLLSLLHKTATSGKGKHGRLSCVSEGCRNRSSKLRLCLIARVKAEVPSKHPSVKEILVHLITFALATNADANAFLWLHKALDLHFR